ncbi:TPA: DNA repair protein RecN [bacterium]|nr:DNA repair protein RecN [bacterium]
MLQELNIKNYALIEKLRLDLSSGLNILTGETGAGKSIILGALGLILGERGNIDSIRTGEDSAVIKALMDVSNNSNIADILSKINLNVEDNEGILLLSREISKNGRSRCWINDQSSTISTLREIGDYLVDIHGQHEHQTLFRSEKHLEILDDFAGLKEHVKDINNLYNQLRKLILEHDQLLKEREESLKEKDLLEFQLNEIKDAKLDIDEEEKLLRERQILNNAELIFELANKIYQCIYDSDDPNIPSVLDILKSLRADLLKLRQVDSELEELESRYENTIYELEDIASQIIDYRDGVEFDPRKIAEVESRLDLIHKLKRKYGTETIAGLLEYKNIVSSKLNDITLSSSRIDIMEEEIREITDKAKKSALMLSEKRQDYAKKLKKMIEKELKTLGMERTVFEVQVTQNEILSNDEDYLILNDNGKNLKFSSNGIDFVEFLISPNPGEDLRPLTKIASGGEISRIMLAIKTVLATGTTHSSPVTLIFDEIDTGIGGRIAEVVGRKLKELSKSLQVICITHLPQIASLADTHYRVQKKVINDRTIVEVENLDADERVREIARMLAGEKITDVTLAHASEMIQQAKEERS